MAAENPAVFIVDDDDAICQSLRLLIEDIGLPVRTFSSARQFLSQCDPSQGGCLVLDVRMSDMSGLELQLQLAKRQIRIPTIIITGHGDVPMAVTAMKAGAFDFIEKPFRDQILLDSIQRAIAQDASARREHNEVHSLRSRVELLTARERQIMDRLVLGKANKAIAYELGISQKTVDFHRANVLAKLGANSVVKLVHLAQRVGSA